jgi:hypothetical protein
LSRLGNLFKGDVQGVEARVLTRKSLPVRLGAAVTTPATMSSPAKGVRKENEIDRADQIDNRTGRTGQAQRPAPQSSEDMLGR